MTATVVRAQRPTSVEPGNVALVLADGTIEGFVGGVCAEHSVRAYSLQAIDSGEAVLLRILPFDERREPGRAEVAAEDGAVTVQNPCLSGGAIEIFLEPVLPAPRVLVVGRHADRGARSCGSARELGLDVVARGAAPTSSRGRRPRAGRRGARPRRAAHAARAASRRACRTSGLVASPKRGTGVLAELRGDGVPDEQLARIDVPAGLDIGARTPAEIALSILAQIVAVRRAARGRDDAARRPRSRAARAAAPLAVDPICGMTVAAVAEHAVARARRRDRLLLLRGLQGQVRGAARACPRRGVSRA